MMRALRRFLRERDAGPIVEFAVVVPVLLLLLFGIVDFAQAFFQRNNLVAAVREGARFAASHNAPCSDAGKTEIRGQVSKYFNNVTGNTLPVVPAIAFTPDICGTTPLNLEAVMVCVRNYPVNSTISKLIKRPITIQASAVFRWEQAPPTITDPVIKC